MCSSTWPPGSVHYLQGTRNHRFKKPCLSLAVLQIRMVQPSSWAADLIFFCISAAQIWESSNPLIGWTAANRHLTVCCCSSSHFGLQKAMRPRATIYGSTCLNQQKYRWATLHLFHYLHLQSRFSKWFFFPPQAWHFLKANSTPTPQKSVCSNFRTSGCDNSSWQVSRQTGRKTN